MSILIANVGLPFPFSEEEALTAARRKCGLAPADVKGGGIRRRSLDLRHGALRAICTVELALTVDEAAFAARCGDADIRLRAPVPFPSPTGREECTHRPVVVGFGPAGIFSALVLARCGYRPLVLERGGAMEQRDRAVAQFFSGGGLDENTNIPFGEGGAGAYSDGKLTTRIGDPRCELVLQLLRQHGAPEEALQAAKPHIGTDLLKTIVVSMRREIEALGGQVRFGARVEELILEGGALRGLRLEEGDIPCQTAVLAIGHSARDSFHTLFRQGIALEAKPFSVGVRAEHLQGDIDRALYGKYAGMDLLPPGEYALSYREGQRGCYSFCMCPGGEVVAAASEEGGVVTNGMSYHARAGRNANAALCVSVGPEAFGAHPLDGIAFQRRLERAAFAAGGGNYTAPVQLLGDFLHDRDTLCLGGITPTYPRGWRFCRMDSVLPTQVCGMLRRALPRFGQRLRGFDRPDAVLTGVETRTSSPVRILRGDDLFSPTARGLIPCGEGAGYAGGIMSAAVDGIRAAEAILSRLRPPEN